MEHDFVTYDQSFYASTELQYWAERYLKVLPPHIDTLLCRGRSGTMIASAMVAISKRPLSFILIRKVEEESHSCRDYGGNYCDNAKATIVDDFIDTGKTINAIELWASKAGVVVDSIIVGHINDMYHKPMSNTPIITVGVRRYRYG